DAREELERVEGRERVRSPGLQRPLDDDELLLYQRIETDCERKQEGDLVGQAPAVHGHAPLKRLGRQGEEGGGQAPRPEAQAQGQGGVQAWDRNSDEHAAQVSGPEIWSAFDQERVHQRDRHHDRQHQKKKGVVLRRRYPCQAPDGGDQQEEQQPGLGHQKADQQVGHDENQLGPGIEPVEKRILTAELVERSHFATTPTAPAGNRPTASSIESGRGSSPSLFPRAVTGGGFTNVRRSSFSSRNTCSGGPNAITSPSQRTVIRSQWAATRCM